MTRVPHTPFGLSLSKPSPERQRRHFTLFSGALRQAQGERLGRWAR